ncbi:EutN/CcmL family microcompartment protein [Vibrio sp. SCSIO 43137]|uniref:EutN/CcmL family microcompartment protein n=1 Tax=Vibrio sp. SCSIO 43137 TaxID=3021011 RepID=UPI0023076C48|nr:EutN/CcmL family microcompartment protein [Vibrio sp. SCSIO 43137]WCE28605.1 EutN/CcmL family microcompartment protein [Vibrio sp. SCSIO 43137]
MRVAKVVGQVVATIRSPDMRMDKLCLVEFVDKKGKSTSEVHVAMDQLGAGEGEWVLVVSGSSARMAYGAGGEHSPVDLCVVGIIDEITSDQSIQYHKGQ